VKPRFIVAASLLFVLLTLAIWAGSSRFAPDVSAFGPRAQSVQVPADCDGEPCDAVVRGHRAFFDRELDGLGANGRACADCHMATSHFQLSPADVEARFRILQLRRRGDPNADDPLFRPVDADDFRINGETAGDFSNLRQNGLVRVTLPLPPNIRLVDPVTNAQSTETLVDVWRAVPTVNDVKLTGPDGINPWPRGPNNSGGYQLDARVTTLQEQALGALINHAQIQSVPPQQLLDDLASFQRVLFTNHRIRALSNAISAGDTSLPDPDGPLNELEEQGKAVFVRACAQCHGEPTQSTPQAPVVRFHSIFSQCPRPVDTATPARFAFAPCPDRLARNARTYEITVSVPTPCPPPAGRVTPCPGSPAPGIPAPPLPAGAKIRRTSSDPGRALLTGFVGGAPPTDDWEKLDVSALRGIRSTAPYFHNNSAGTLEEVVDHYIEFFKRVQANSAPGVVPPLASTDGVRFDRQPAPEERAALVAYLRTLR
jgi:cytochrome c peroxidase